MAITAITTTATTTTATTTTATATTGITATTTHYGTYVEPAGRGARYQAASTSASTPTDADAIAEAPARVRRRAGFPFVPRRALRRYFAGVARCPRVRLR